MIEELKTKIEALVAVVTNTADQDAQIGELRAKLDQLEKDAANLENDRPDLSAAEVVRLRREVAYEIEVSRIELARIEKSRARAIDGRAHELREVAAQVGDVMLSLSNARREEVQKTLSSLLPEGAYLDWTRPTLGLAGELRSFVNQCKGVEDRINLSRHLKNPNHGKNSEAEMGNLTHLLKAAAKLL